MVRITLAPDQRPPRPSLMIRGALAVSRRMYGRDLDSVRAMSHHPGVFWPWALMEVTGERRRSRLPRHLDDLVVVATAMHLGCSWCIDFGWSRWERKGLDRDVPAYLRRWRDAERFDDDTRAALAFAEAASGDLDQVSVGMVEDLRRRFGEGGGSSWLTWSRWKTCARGSTPHWACGRRASAEGTRARSRCPADDAADARMAAWTPSADPLPACADCRR